jgi:hypothetical protein
MHPPATNPLSRILTACYESAVTEVTLGGDHYRAALEKREICFMCIAFFVAEINRHQKGKVGWQTASQIASADWLPENWG